ncbi:MAG: hypothetical protein QOC94_2515 [Actinoplanes sp.]|jgi:hypothetical protein|nr:hypothetical protein [Actinoplanes sp.]
MDNYFLLMDPAWKPTTDADVPPMSAIIGLWPLEDDGKVGQFRTNPEYEPQDEKSPSDPIDAVLRLLVAGAAEMEQVQLMLRNSLFDLAMNGDGRPLIVTSPDDVSCAVLTTGEPHRLRVSAPDWRRTDLEGLVSLLADGIDVFVNPGGPAAVRLTGHFIRKTTLLTDSEAAALHEQFRTTEKVSIMTLGPGVTITSDDDEPPDDDDQPGR